MVSTGRCPAFVRSLPPAAEVAAEVDPTAFVPTPDHAAAALADAQPGGDRRLTDEVQSRSCPHRRAGTGRRWDVTRVPDHLRITFSVDDDRGRALATGKDLDSLKDRDGRPGAAPDVASGSRDRAKRPVAVGLRATAGDVRDRVGRPAGAGLPGSGRPRRERRPRRAAGEREAGRRRASASGASCCSTRPRPGSASSPGSPTPRSWRSGTTRTAPFPRCSRTASPARSTPSSPSGRPAACAMRRPLRTCSPACAPTPPRACWASSTRSSRCCPWPARSSRASAPSPLRLSPRWRPT